jgi:hypothetical protein
MTYSSLLLTAAHCRLLQLVSACARGFRIPLHELKYAAGNRNTLQTAAAIRTLFRTHPTLRGGVSD